MLGKRLKELRKEYGLTQKELGEKIGVNDNTVTNYEKEIRQPSYEILENIAGLFNCSISYLLGETNIRSQYMFNNPKEYFDSLENQSNRKEYEDEYARITLEPMRKIYHERRRIAYPAIKSIAPSTHSIDVEKENIITDISKTNLSREAKEAIKNIIKMQQ